MANPDGLASLAVFGLSTAEQAAYALLVDRHTATAEQLAADWSSAEPVGDVLSALVSAGFAYPSAGSPTRFIAVAPRAVLDARLIDGLRRLRIARDHANRLIHDYRSAATSNGAVVVEQITGAGAVRERLLRALRSARTELRRLAAAPDFDPAVTAAGRELAGRGVAVRTLRRSAEPHEVAGEQVRLLEDLPVSLFLIDDRLAVVPVDRTNALVVHPGELLRTLGLLFDGLWERAGTPHRPGPAQGDRLLELLLSGLTDQAIGRALGTSTRTTQRHIAAMMDAAGARSRFQAGVQAALRRSR
jgi:sugar-specific transcriptional regulator TrmB/DNA-binding CsgD family transcriptional regulator